HDNMTNWHSFENMFPDLVGDFKQKMVDYMSILLGTHRAANNTLQQDTTPSVLTCPDSALEQDSDGFPILPPPPSNMVQTQPELEMLIQDYLNSHYSKLVVLVLEIFLTKKFSEIASGFHCELAPYNAVQLNCIKFINSRYLPESLEFKDSHNLGWSQLLCLLKFWRDCQEEHGSSDTFWWKVYINKNKNRVPAEYGTHADHEKRAAAAVSPKAAQKKGEHQRKQKHVGLSSDDLASKPTGTLGIACQSNPSSKPGILSQSDLSGNPASNTSTIEPDLLGNPASNASAVEPDLSGKPSTTSMSDVQISLEIVNNVTIQQLWQRGWNNLITPINSPADWSPCYTVPRSVLEILNQEEDTHETETEETPSYQLAYQKHKTSPDLLLIVRFH
ncbi:hypothetical protein C0989_003242, partial [Termitomyces sp. Mn162]